MTATEWLTIMLIVLTVELLYLIGEALYHAFRRELNADTLRHVQSETAHYDFLYGGSAAQGVETPLSAPGCPSPLHPGADPNPRTAALSSSPPSCGEALPGSGGPGQSSRSEPVPPDLAPVGVAPHPRGEGVGAACPRQVTPTMDAA